VLRIGRRLTARRPDVTLSVKAVAIVRRGEAANRATRSSVSVREPARMPQAGTVPEPAPAEMHLETAEADTALTALYRAHYSALVRLAVLLVSDSATAEEVVQDSFAAMDVITYRSWGTGRALSSLRAAVVNRSRSAWRQPVVDETATTRTADMPVAGYGQLAPPEESAVVTAVRNLPCLQREVVALRCYCDLSDVQIAATMGITARAVNRHASRAMAALRAVLESES
jgi:DNA-directed RNA polymerase specialized sigma24 family protein